MSLEINSATGLGGLTKQDIQTITDILAQQTNVEKALLFGSRAKGNYKHGSDVDIALKGRQLNVETISNISYLLNEETFLPYKFDILNYYSTSKKVTGHIDRVGIVFYENEGISIGSSQQPPA
jgi:predicted nucleotidyltransferase